MGAGYHGGFGNTKGSRDKQEKKNEKLTIQHDKQGKHIVGSKTFVAGKSTFLGSIQTAEKLIREYSGKGEAIGPYKERVDFGEVIGFYCSPQTKQSIPTTMGIIHYSKNGAHIVPARPKNMEE